MYTKFNGYKRNGYRLWKSYQIGYLITIWEYSKSDYELCITDYSEGTEFRAKSFECVKDAFMSVDKLFVCFLKTRIEIMANAIKNIESAI